MHTAGGRKIFLEILNNISKLYILGHVNVLKSFIHRKKFTALLLVLANAKNDQLL